MSWNYVIATACFGITLVMPIKVLAGETQADATAQQKLLKRGKLVYFKCQACHELQAKDGHKVGPNLAGLMGATAGKKEGFNYSKALSESTMVWDKTTLDTFILKPSALFSGTKMAFIGLENELDRQALIAYLRENTSLDKTSSK